MKKKGESTPDVQNGEAGGGRSYGESVLPSVVSSSTALTQDRVREELDLRELVERAQREAERVAQEAGKMIYEEYFGKVAMEEKQDSNLIKSFVTEADRASEDFIKTELQAAFPNFSFLGEEGGMEGSVDNDFQWVVDPLDGTTNFGNNIDFFCVSIGLLHRGKPVMGVLYIPAEKKILSGSTFSKPKSNGKDISVYNGPLTNKVPFFDETRSGHQAIFSPEIQAVKAKGRIYGSSVRVFSSIADGGFAYGVQSQAYLWDIVAALSIIREGGGDMLVWDDDQWKTFEEVYEKRKNDPSISWSVITAGKQNLDFVKHHVTLTLDRKNPTTKEKPRCEISESDISGQPTEAEQAVMKKWELVVPKLVDIVKNVLARTSSVASLKADGTEVTEADILIEREMKQLLATEFPGAFFIGEEGGVDETKQDIGFIIDPIDGTTNYVNGLPFSSVVGLVKDGKVIGGFIFFPMTDTVIFNTQNAAFVQRRGSSLPMRVRDDAFSETAKDMPFGFDTNARLKVSYHEDIKRILKKPRTFGGVTSLVGFTATGSLGGFVLSGAKLWDYAGGVSLIEKGGGCVFVFDERENTWKSFDLMLPELLREPDKKRFVVGGGNDTVHTILRNIQPHIK